MALLPGQEITVGGVTANVRIDGYKKGNVMGSGPWRRVKYLCPGSTSDTFMDALMGLTSYSGGVGGFVTWPIPHAYPGNTNLRCVEVEGTFVNIEPDGDKLVSGDYCEVDAVYRALPFDVEGNQDDLSFDGNPRPWVRDERKGLVNTFKLPVGTIEHAPGEAGAGDMVQTPQHLRVIQYDYRRTIHGLPYRVPDSIISLGGKLNDATFWGQPRGTFYFEPIDEVTEIQTDGARMNVVTLTLNWRPYDWNKFTDDSVDPVKVIRVGGSATDTPYEYADFAPIGTLGS